MLLQLELNWKRVIYKNTKFKRVLNVKDNNVKSHFANHKLIIYKKYLFVYTFL